MKIKNNDEVESWLFKHKDKHLIGIKGYITGENLPVNIAWMVKDNPSLKVHIYYV